MKKKYTRERVEAMFWEIFNRSPIDDNGCRIWAGTRINKYGHFYRGYAHMFALELKLGRKLAPGMETCHDCGNHLCVNFDHLYEGTHKQNMQDMIRHGRGSDSRPGHPAWNKGRKKILQ